MKKETFVGIKISDNEENLIGKISSHLTDIEQKIDFEKYNKTLNINLVNTSFHFTYEKSIFFEKDMSLINEFNNRHFIIEDIETVFFENDFLSVSNLYWLTDKLMPSEIKFLVLNCELPILKWKA